MVLILIPLASPERLSTEGVSANEEMFFSGWMPGSFPATVGAESEGDTVIRS